jgi:hypothetical protein
MPRAKADPASIRYKFERPFREFFEFLLHTESQ